MAKPKLSKKKKINKEKYEQQAKAIGKTIRKTVRNNSGYLTPKAKELVPGKGLLSYTEKTDEPQEKEEKEDGFLAFENVSEEHPLAQQFKDFEKEMQEIPLPKYPAPWNSNDKSTNVTAKFNQEVRSYTVYVSPEAQELRARSDLVERITTGARTLNRTVQCHLFGSSATDMYLPQADVDMVLIPQAGVARRQKSLLYMLREYIVRSGWGKEVKVIGRARVPILKFKDSKSLLSVDISVGQTGGVEAIKTVENWKKMYPALRPLVLVIKQFLKRRNLGEVFHGGLGGYATICMVTSFLANHPKLKNQEIEAMDNLGVLLLEFFEFYGSDFNCTRYALRMTGPMPRVLKSTSGTLQTQKPDMLSIEDPNDHSNNISKSSYNWPTVRKEMGHAADLLKRMMHEYSTVDPETLHQYSFLSVLLKNESNKTRKYLDEDARKKMNFQALKPPRLPSRPPTDSRSIESRLESRSIESRLDERKGNRPKEKKAEQSNTPKKNTKKDSKKQSKAADSSLDQKPEPTKRSRENETVLDDLYGPASSDSDVQVTQTKKATPASKLSDSETEDESRTKTVAQSKTAINAKRQFWLNKSGV